jgi:phenylalanyl-tRNA synthetase beta chain
MATITFKIDDLVSASGVKEIDKIVDRLGMGVEEMKDGSITIDVTPNRPDLLYMQGMARAIANFAGKKEPVDNFYKVAGNPVIEIEVGQGLGQTMPYIGGVVAKGLNLKGSNLVYLINFLEKLDDTYGRRRKKISTGINDMSKIKGNLKYYGASEGKFRPLGHDKEMTFGKILELHKKGVQYGSVLEGAKKYPILADSDKIIALIPIINTEASKITESTTDAFIDVTGTSQQAVDQMLKVIACALIDAGVDVYPVTVTKGKKSWTTPTLEYKEVTVKLGKIDRTIGNELTESDLVALTNRMGYTSSKYGDGILVEVPPYRIDFFNEQDIVEDIAIAYGYENIQPMPVIGTFLGVTEDIMDLSDRVSMLMVGMGFTESYNNYLTNEKNCFERMGREFDKKEIVSITYSKTETFTILRDSVLPSLMENIGHSVHEKMPQRLFEVGRTFRIKNGKIVESIKLAFVIEHSKANFSEAKACADNVFRHLGVKPKIEIGKSSSYIEGRCAVAKIGENLIATFGEIHPSVLEAFKLEEPVAAFEIDIIKEVPYFDGKGLGK